MVASGKNLREQRNVGAQRILRGSHRALLKLPRCLAGTTGRGTARGGNCVKVDVGYAEGRPFRTRNNKFPTARAVTKVRARRLVSRSVSGRVDIFSPSSPTRRSFRHLRRFVPFSFHPCVSRSLSPENPRIDSSAIIHRRPWRRRRRPSSASITARFFLFHLPAAYE